jgi:outer membrane protein assembly factor BamB
MLSGQYAQAIQAFRPFKSGSLGLASQRATGACYLALERIPEAADAWSRELRLPLPLPEELARGPWPRLETVRIQNEGNALGDYPLEYIALVAARTFASSAPLRPGLDRTVEFLLRQAVRFAPASTLLQLTLAEYLQRSYLFTAEQPAPGAAQLREARALLEAVLAREPKNARALTGLGRLEEAVQANPDYLPARQHLASRYLQANDPRALAELEAVKQLAPNSFYHEQLIGALAAQGHRRLALEEAQQLVKLGSDRNNSYQKRQGQFLSGILYQEAGVPGMALDQYRSLAAPPGTRRPEAQHDFGLQSAFLAGLAALETGSIEQAEPYFRASAMAPAYYRPAAAFLAWIARRRGDEGGFWREMAATGFTPGQTVGFEAVPPLFSLNRSLQAVLKQFPDCLAARYLAAVHALRGFRDDPAARETLWKLAAELPDWPAPLQALTLSNPDRSSPEALELRRRGRRLAARLAALQAKEGAPSPRLPLALAWSVTGEESGRPLTDGRSLFTSDSRSLQRLSPLNGAPLAARATPLLPAPPVLAGGRLIVTHEQVAAAYDAESLKRLWVQPLEQLSAWMPAADERHAFFLLPRGELIAFDARLGTPLWATPCGSPPTAPPTLLGDQAIVATENGTVRGIGAADGRLRWKRRLAEPPEEAAYQTRRLVVAGGRIFFLAQQHSTQAGDWLVGALDSSGKPLWSTRLNLGSRQTNCFALEGGRTLLVVGEYRARLILLDGAMGRELATHSLETEEGREMVASVAAGWLFLRTPDGSLCATDPKSGKVLWKSDEPLPATAVLSAGPRVIAWVEGWRQLLGFVPAPGK